MNAKDLVKLSIQTGKPAWADYSQELHLELSSICDDYMEGESCVGYWGPYAVGGRKPTNRESEWRVYLRKKPRQRKR